MDGPEEVVTNLHEQGVLVHEIKAAKIGSEEYGIDLMNDKAGQIMWKRQKP